MLHHHHASEDELLYPLLIQRAPEEAAETERTQHQHKEVEGTIEAATNACVTWRKSPSAESGEALATSLEALNEALQPHLDDEEQITVPLAAVTLTQAEWDKMGEQGTAGIPKKMLPVAFGMLLEPLNESDRALMKAELPGFVRLFYGPLIQRPWNKYKKTLRTGT